MPIIFGVALLILTVVLIARRERLWVIAGVAVAGVGLVLTTVLGNPWFVLALAAGLPSIAVSGGPFLRRDDLAPPDGVASPEDASPPHRSRGRRRTHGGRKHRGR